MAGIIDGEEIDFEQYMHDTEVSAKVLEPKAWIEQMIKDADAKLAKGMGMVLPWSKSHHDVELRPGELSIWAGVNGHGKSLVTGQVALSLMHQGYKCLIASFEMKPPETIRRLTQQCAGTERYTHDYLRKWGEWSDGRLWIYNQTGNAKAEQVKALCRYAREELGIDHVFIDSLMKCIPHEDDYNAQKMFVGELHTIAQDTGLHIHLVHHMRKGEDEHKPGGKFALKGSGAITDQPDNVWTVWKNKKKLDAIADGDNDADLLAKPDCILKCEKQRNGRKEPKYALWFHEQSTQLLGGQGQPIYEYLRETRADLIGKQEVTA